jgi:hypothetical protein
VAAEIFAGEFDFTVRDPASGKISRVRGSFRITSFDEACANRPAGAWIRTAQLA